MRLRKGLTAHVLFARKLAELQWIVMNFGLVLIDS